MSEHNYEVTCNLCFDFKNLDSNANGCKSFVVSNRTVQANVASDNGMDEALRKAIKQWLNEDLPLDFNSLTIREVREGNQVLVKFGIKE